MPRPFRSALFGSACAAVLAVGLAPAGADPSDDLRHDRHDVTQRIGSADRDLDESSAQLQEATAALLEARGDLAEAQARLSSSREELATAQALDRRLQRQLEEARSRLAGAHDALRLGRGEVAAQERRLRRSVVTAYERGGADLVGLSVVVSTQDPAELLGRLSASSSVANAESASLDRLRATRVLLTVQEQEMRAAAAEVADRRAAAAANLADKQRLEEQASVAEQQVSSLVDLTTEAEAAARKAKRSDLEQLRVLAAERSRIQRLIRQQASVSSVVTPVRGGGVLDRPVPGPITSMFGWRVHPIYGYRSLHDGIDIGAACGTPIRAAADGEVLSEYYQTAWGNRLIIDHGVHHGVGVATISNHLSGYRVGVGEHVERGEVVGYVGTTGWSTGCHLHFTVLQNGAAVDPVPWF